MTEYEVSQKYYRIEDKIPSVWKTYQDIGCQLLVDLLNLPSVSDLELARVIVVSNYTNINLRSHINPKIPSFALLYPHVHKPILFKNMSPEMKRLYKFKQK